MSRDLYSIPYIGETLRRKRVAARKTQLDVARDARVTQATLSLVERGADVRMSTVMAIAAALDLEIVFVPRKATRLVKDVLETLP